MNFLFKKVITLKKILKKYFLSYKYNYYSSGLENKPVGVLTDLVTYSKDNPECKMIKVSNSYQSVREIDKDLEDKISGYINEDIITFAPDLYMVQLNKGRVYYDKLSEYSYIITPENYVVADEIFQHNNIRRHIPEQINILKYKYFSDYKVLKGNSFSFVNGNTFGNNNYFHWLFDYLSRLHFLKKYDLFEKIDYFIVPDKFGKNFHYDSFSLNGIDISKIIKISEYVHVRCDNLIMCSHPRHNHIPQWIPEYYNSYPGIANIKDSGFKKLYITRGKVKNRIIINENEITDFLLSDGFHIIDLNDLPFEEQIGLFHYADFVIAPHGAGLANLLFSRPHTKVIEIFSPDYIYPVYSDLSYKKNLDYRFFVSDSDTNWRVDNRKEGQKQNLKIDISEFSKLYDGFSKQPYIN